MDWPDPFHLTLTVAAEGLKAPHLNAELSGSSHKPLATRSAG